MQTWTLYIGGEFSRLIMSREETYVVGIAADKGGIANSALG